MTEADLRAQRSLLDAKYSKVAGFARVLKWFDAGKKSRDPKRSEVSEEVRRSPKRYEVSEQIRKSPEFRVL
jgi:hypothetical protein